jgi:5-methylthioadenosine/S-adenosylhomocysteine deaminase
MRLWTVSAPSAESSVPNESDLRLQVVDWLLYNIDWLVTCNETMQCVGCGAVAIKGDTLVAVGSGEHVRSRFIGRREMDLKGHLIMPGLINTHTHAAMSCFRGIGDDLPLLRWLHDVIFPAEAAHVNQEMVHWGTLLSIVEMLKNGITTFCDGYFFELAAAKAAEESGIRAVLGQGVIDFPSPDQPDPTRSKNTAMEFLGRFPASDRLRPSIFCHSPYTCGAETLKWASQLCREQGILFQMHLSETAPETEEILKKHGEPTVSYLDRLGVLDDHTLCAHGVWLAPAEIDILALRGVSISHNAESNMKLASGIAPVPALLAAGVRVSLGTDGCASNNDLDLFSEMDMVAKLHKVFNRQPVLCSATEVLKMATRGGAGSLGWSDEIGSLEAGKKADLIAIDLNQPHLTPVYNPVSQLVYSAKGSDVRHVWVNGRQIVSEGEVQTIDVSRITEEIKRIAREIFQPL